MTQPVPPLNLQAAFAPIRDEILREITAVCDSGHFILGPKVVEFENAMAAYSGAKFALGLSSGTDALLLAMMALDIGAGDEVIVPSFTFFATGGCVSRLGARPVFVDVHEDTFNIDVSQVESRITSRTRAIIPVHLYGQLADMRSLDAIAARRGIAIIEDAAQAIGSYEYRGERGDKGNVGRQAGAIGAFGCLSFYPTKNLGAMGDAGMLLSNDAALAEKARLLRTHGENPKYYHHMIGGNFRIDALQAAVLNIKLRYLEKWIEGRRVKAATYNRLFESAGLTPEFVRTPVESDCRHVYHQYVIRAPRRDELMKHLQSRQIGCAVYYPVPLHLQKCFASLGGKAGDLPVSERVAGQVLALPIYPELTDAQQQAVVEVIVEFYGRRGS